MEEVQILCIRNRHIYTLKKPPTPQPPFSVDCNFVNSANRAIGFHANGIFCFQKPRKNALVIVKILLSGNSRIFSPKPDFTSCLVTRLEELSTWPTCPETPLWAQEQSLILLLWAGQQVSVCSEEIRQCVQKTVAPSYEQ